MAMVEKTKIERGKRKNPSRKTAPAQMQGQQRDPALHAQQSGGESTGRSPSDWPPNTWWP